MPAISNHAGLGLVTARDPSTLKPGELTEATGGEYRIGTPHWHKQPGRSSTSNALGANVKGLCKFQYDTASDVLVAVAGGTVYESAATTTPTFSSSGLTGLTTSAQPTFVGFNERWIMCNGVDSNYMREPAAPPSGGFGNWRTVGMLQPTKPVSAVGIGSSTTLVRPASNTSSGSNYTNPDRAYDTDTETYASGNTNKTVTYSWSSNFSAASCTLFVDHLCTSATGVHGPANPKFDVTTVETDPGSVLVEYTVTADTTNTWIPIVNSSSFSRTTHSKPLTIGTAISTKLKVRATTTVGTVNHQIFDIRVSAGSSTAYATTSTNGLVYGVTEIYYDSDGNELESQLSPTYTMLTADINGKYGVTLTLSAKINTKATNFGIYRSVEEDGGGYPNMYRIDTPLISDLAAVSYVWTDDFAMVPSAVPDGKPILSYLAVTFPTNETFYYESNGSPPIASIALPFNCAMCYVPTANSLGHRLYYSLASTISKSSMEQVPAFQYLDFQSPRNDVIISIAVTNGGRSLLVFFANYTMLVNFLPQAADGIFDNRIKEYVSNNRGTAGVQTCVEFTLPAGQTYVASVDALGLWITNGVNRMDEWTKDLDWKTDLADVDLSTAILVDNVPKRRLELQYTTAAGGRAEYHFFYGRLKQDEAGREGPLISGPHPMGVRVKHYTQIGSTWEGFSGDASATGNIFLEEAQASDAANGYDSNGKIPWSWTMGDVYPEGLTRSHIIEQMNMKFGDGNDKDYTVDVTLKRDTGVDGSLTKTYSSGSQQQIYIHRYCDRHHIQIQDISATAASPFIGYEVEIRPAGPTRDR